MYLDEGKLTFVDALTHLVRCGSTLLWLRTSNITILEGEFP